MTVPLLVAGSVLVAGASANASAGHFNTNPYTTGCSKTASTISSKAVSGGRMYIKASSACGTNWVEYRGNTQKTTKTGKDARTNTWTRTEVDTASASWSMQSYAPGTTAYTGKLTIGSTTTIASCSNGCTWKTATTASSLGSRVDAFVAKYNGKYVDFDGYYGAQCVDLFNFYNRDVVKARFAPASYAYQLWGSYDTTRYIKVSASSTPRKGDVAIWSSNYPYSGGAGHVAIVLSASGTTFTALTQNPGATKKATFSKSYVIGFLRPRS
ncbi:CHAP domain-containing protein [Phycicoccus sp. BSK3Z-2]|uniref:CHAP domain-containing protein n=1 Tax=Phycicoccus avicenniae TaxID=2828860 RepID=A0A941DB48_9MICO|nr:CHAP domain-containing protein [Phycicoccus avicenniae]MBR7744180.1 CHAP domain-containing protein [Phycicoccus avicenniae]